MFKSFISIRRTLSLSPVLFILAHLNCLPVLAHPDVSLLDSLSEPSSSIGLSFEGSFDGLITTPDFSSEMRIYRGENLDSSKAWIIENSRFPGVTPAIQSPPSGRALMKPSGSLLFIPAAHVDLTGGPAVHSYGWSSSEGKSASPPNNSAKSTTRDGTASKSEEEKKKKDHSGDAQIFSDIQAALYSDIPIHKEAKQLLRNFQQLERVQDPELIDQYKKVNNILKTGVYGPEKMPNAGQFLDYVEYLEQMSDPKKAFLELHEYFRRKKLLLLGDGNTAIDQKKLLYVTQVSLRLLEQKKTGTEILHADWEALFKRIRDGQELHELASFFAERYPKYDPHLYIKSLILFATQYKSFHEILPKIKYLMIQLNLKWLDLEQLPVAELHHYLLTQVNILKPPVSPQKKAEIEGLFKLARQRTEAGSKGMEMVYHKERLFYKKLAIPSAEAKAEAEAEDEIITHLENGQFQAALDEIDRFTHEGDYKLPPKLADKLDFFKLQSLASLFSQTRKSALREMAIRLIPKMEEADVDEMALLRVLRSLEIHNTVRARAIDLIIRRGAFLLSAKELAISLEILADSTAAQNLNTALFYYTLLIGTLHFPEALAVFASCPPDDSCQKIEIILRSRPYWSSENGLRSGISAHSGLVALYQTLRRFGYYREALDLGQQLWQKHPDLLLPHQLPIQLIVMSYITGKDKEGLKYLESFAQSHETDHNLTSVIGDLIEDNDHIEKSLDTLIAPEQLTCFKLYIKYNKLIYLIRQYQLANNQDAIFPFSLEIDFLFEELHKSTTTLISEFPQYKDALILQGLLQRAYDVISDTLITEGSSWEVLMPSDHYLELAGGQEPSFLDAMNDFIHLLELITQKTSSENLPGNSVQ